MYENIATTLARAEEHLAELLAEYGANLRNKEVTARALQLTHDACEKLRSVLDRTVRRYWSLHISPNLLEEDRKAALIYFPIAPHQAGMVSTLGRWRWRSV